ncbi:MAG: flagellar protein FlgN [Firmicutes bacterium]|jgi:flagellar biosynthesis/type III secretory pathway chaperone|nr:flagellar protein FlgN [Bacillota bacterium]
MQQVFDRKQAREGAETPLSIELTELVDGLVEILSQETATIQGLIKEADRKQAALTDDDLAALEEIVALETGLLQELEDCEARRLNQVAAIERHLGDLGSRQEDGSSPSFGKMVRKIGGSKGEELHRQGQTLKENTLHLKELNLLNADLLRQSLTLTNYCLSLVTGDPGQGIYGEPGKKERKGYQQNMLDARA